MLTCFKLVCLSKVIDLGGLFDSSLTLCVLHFLIRRVKFDVRVVCLKWFLSSFVCMSETVARLCVCCDFVSVVCLLPMMAFIVYNFVLYYKTQDVQPNRALKSEWNEFAFSHSSAWLFLSSTSFCCVCLSLCYCCAWLWLCILHSKLRFSRTV